MRAGILLAILAIILLSLMIAPSVYSAPLGASALLASAPAQVDLDLHGPGSWWRSPLVLAGLVLLAVLLVALAARGAGTGPALRE